MHEEIIFAGFGGQGVLFAGQLLAYTALEEGRQVTWIPSYGPEMRGGTANCHVNLSHRRIGSPVVSRPTVLVAMNLPSLEKFEGEVAAGASQTVMVALSADAVSQIIVTFRSAAGRVAPVPRVTLADQLTR